jgi:hypothetical protein
LPNKEILTMIDLTPEQRQSLLNGDAVRIRDNGQEYVLLRPDVYARLAERDEDSWTADELDLLREEAVELLDNYGKTA